MIIGAITTKLRSGGGAHAPPHTPDGSRQIGLIQEIKLLKQGHQYLSKPVEVAFF